MNTTGEALIDADVEIENQIREDSRDHQDISSERGANTALLAAGGFDTAKNADEQTPLLGSHGNHGGQQASDEDTGNEWPGQGDFEGLPWWKRPSIYWMLPAFLLFSLAFGGSIMPKLNLIKNLICRRYYQELADDDPTVPRIPINYGGNNEQCHAPEIRRLYTVFTLAGTIITGVISAFTSAKLGALSDRYGRRLIIGLTTVGMLTGEIITIFAATYPDTFQVDWLLLGYAIDGLSGSFISGMAIAHAYAADCTPPSRRNVAFGYFHGCLFAGIGLGPLLFGLIVKLTDSLLFIFYLALLCHSIFIVSLMLVIPESLSKRRQLQAREKHAKHEAEKAGSHKSLTQRVTVFLQPLKIFWPTGEGSSAKLRRNLVILAAVDTIMFGVAMGAMNVIVDYINSQFDWDVPQQSYYMSTVNLVRVFGLLAVLPIVTRLVRGKKTTQKPQPQKGADMLDLTIIRAAVALDTVGFLGYTLAPSGGWFVAAGCVAAMGGIGGPTMSSALTKHIPADRTGELLGASALLHALARVVAPLVFSSIYAATVGRFTQTVFLCLAVTFGVAAVISWFLKPNVYLNPLAGNDRTQREHEQDS